ncbi:MAG: AsnC family transcriptional regulator [Candidatus Bathyarchaeota archaeon]
MDEVDWKIINQLQKDGRTTFEELAKLARNAHELYTYSEL